MSTVSDRTAPANTDARLRMVYLGLLDALELDPAAWDDSAPAPVAAVPGPAVPPACGPWGGEDGEDEDRDARHAGEARAHLDEDAWYSGFSLGYSGVSADAPSGMSGHQKRAFLAGLEAGWQALEHDDRLEWADKFESETRALMMAHEDLEAYFEEQDLAYAGITRKAV